MERCPTQGASFFFFWSPPRFQIAVIPLGLCLSDMTCPFPCEFNIESVETDKFYIHRIIALLFRIYKGN